MAWIESRKKQSGGGSGTFDVLIDYALYSTVSPNQFYTIALPASYSDYDLLMIACVQTGVDHDNFNASMPRSSTELIYIKPSDLTASNVTLQTGIFDSSYSKISTTNFYMSNSSILGTGYPLSWQYMYLVCYGIKYT